MRSLPIICMMLSAASAGASDALLRVGHPQPALLDLHDQDPERLVPKDGRDPRQLEASQRAWSALLGPFEGRDAVRLRLPTGAGRVPILLAACQALKASDPLRRIYIAFDPGGEPIMDEAAWGAVDGGALVQEDLGTDASRWRHLLVRAQESFPGKPWTLWLPADPRSQVSVYLGDGARLVLPEGGPGARLARALPLRSQDVEGGLGVLSLRDRQQGTQRTWRYVDGEWRLAEAPRDRHEVVVEAREAYDVAALLARMRAAQLRARAALRTMEAVAEYDLHFQGERGSGDLGFTFRAFEKTGEGEELLRREVRLNGVRAKLGGDFQVPLVEARTSIAAPVALTLTERYRYEDGGPGGPGVRVLRFRPVDGDATLYSGTLSVQEATGRILEERSGRDGLAGMVRSEHRVLTYGEVAPACWRVVRCQTTERWALGQGVTQVQRSIAYKDPKVNAPDFETSREAARDSDGSMLRQTPDGYRYYVKQKDGTRKIEEKIRTSGKAVGGVIVMQPNMSPPVAPVAGMLFYDFDAFGKGIQYNFLTALVFNMGHVMVPNVAWGIDVHATGALSFFSGTERPSKEGKELDKDGVERRSQHVVVGMGRDLGLGFRLGIEGTFMHDRFGEAKEERYRTPGFQLPPSGWTRMQTTTLSWQGRGFQAKAFLGKGRRPEGRYGTDDALVLIPDQGRIARHGGSLGYDMDLGAGRWLTMGAGQTSGRGFDRFQSIDVAEFVQGIKHNPLATDRIRHGDLRFVMPTGPNLRLTLGLEHARARSMDDHKEYGFSGVTLSGDLPGFWWFTTVRVDIGAGVQADIRGTRSVAGSIALMRLF